MITVNKRLLKTTGTPNEIDALTILNKMTIYLCSFVYISLLYYILNIKKKKFPRNYRLN